MVGYLRYMQRIQQKLWPLTKRYWFDALLVVGLGLSLATVVHDIHSEGQDPGRAGLCGSTSWQRSP